jgi:hypothetical protein
MAGIHNFRQASNAIEGRARDHTTRTLQNIPPCQLIAHAASPQKAQLWKAHPAYLSSC